MLTDIERSSRAPGMTAAHNLLSTLTLAIALLATVLLYTCATR